MKRGRRPSAEQVVLMLRRFGRTTDASSPPGSDGQVKDPRHAQEAQVALRAYVEHLEHSPREAYRRYAERLREFNCTTAAEFHNATTAAQRQAAAHKLAGWEADARALAAAAPAAAGALDAGR